MNSSTAVPRAADASTAVDIIARTGYAAKGIVYAIVGVLAVTAAIGAGRATGSSGALQSLVDEPFGRIALGAIALGLACYVIWRAIAATMNPEDEDLSDRAFAAIKALAYAGLAVEAVRLALGGGSGSSGGAESRTATLMSQPFGIWLVGAVGVGIGAYGVYQLVSAWKADLFDRLALGRLSATARRWAVRFGRFGTAARGVVFCMIAAFLVVAAVRADPDQARGLGGALRTLEDQPYGPYLLGAVGIGLFAYGIYQFIVARYRRISV